MTIPENLSRELKSLSTALKQLDGRLQSETSPDPVVLIEFRHSIDNVRLTAWSVSELISTQRTRNEPDNVLAFLSAERVRRLDQLVRNLCGNLDRNVITSKSYGMSSLFDSVTALQQRLANCLAAEQQSEKEVSNTR